MDVGARNESLNVRGEPVLTQLCVVPAYALTIHKTQEFVSISLARHEIGAGRTFRQLHVFPHTRNNGLQFQRKTDSRPCRSSTCCAAPLEGMFALGQVYVLISRVTDPQNLGLIGVPFVVG